MLVFVYGTLKRGGCRHHFLGDARFAGKARTKSPFRLYDCGTYPGMVRGENGLPIEGELWQIEEGQLVVLDEVEGVDESLYERVMIEVQRIETKDGSEFRGTTMEAWTYLYLRSTDGMRELVDRWPG